MRPRAEPGRPRVALFLRDLGGGGAERVALNLAGGLTAHATVELVVGDARGHFSAEVPEGVGIVDLRAPRLRHATPRLAAYLRRARPAALLSALHHTNLAALAAAALARVGTRVVVSSHTHLSRALDQGTRRDRMFLPALIRVAYTRAADVVAVSDGVADDLARLTGIARARITTIHNPIVTPALRAAALEPAGHPWLDRPEGAVLLAAGRLVAPKDFATLLRALARVRESVPARLVILGEGPLRGELERLASELGVAGALSMPGVVRNPFASMARADVFVLSSAWEGFGNVLVEALATGTRVVSTDCPSGPAEILEGGRFGALVPVGDPAALAAAIRTALGAPHDPEASRRRAAAFAVEPIAARYAALLLPDAA